MTATADTTAMAENFLTPTIVLRMDCVTRKWVTDAALFAVKESLVSESISVV